MILKTYFLFFFCVSLTTSFAQIKNYNYTVQIGTFVSANADDFKAIRPYGFVYADQLDKDLHQIYIGGFKNKNKAEQLLKKVKAKGYLDAYVTKRSLDKGKELRMIQLQTFGIKDPINWAKFNGIQNLYVHLDGELIKILTGIFTSENTLSIQLKKIKNSGFNDAFAKTVNSKQLHRLSDFETNGSIVIPTEMEIEKLVTEKTAPLESMTTVEKTKEEFTAKSPTKALAETPPPPVVIPPEYDNINFTPKSPNAFKPKIRENVKRTSALQLQTLLKAAKIYKGSIDGLYGPATTRAYDEMMTNNRQIRKYILLSKYTIPEHNIKPTKLQQSINALSKNTKMAVKTLEQINHPLAKAYRAYVLFVNGGNESKVNQLMNEAIKESFVGKKIKNQPAFDYKATYAYTDLEQLILHLSYIHNANPDNPSVPCWLFQKHPHETAKAFEPFATMSESDYKVEDCGGFMKWKELQLLQTIAKDLYTGKKLNQKNLKELDNERARLFLLPKPLNAIQKTDALNWNENLWTTLDEWAKQDPLHQELITALKLSYYQSAVLLEDYFMDKGLKYTDAKPLALLSLKTVVAPYFENYF